MARARKPQNTPSKTLVRKLCRTLRDTKVMQRKTAVQERSAAISTMLEANIIDLVGRHDFHDDSLCRAMIASGSEALAEIVLDTRSAIDTGPLTLEPQQWSKLLTVSNPEQVRWLLENGVSGAHSTIPLLGHIAGKSTGWESLLLEIADREKHPEILRDRHAKLLTHKPNAEVTASFLRVQVSRFPGHYAELGKHDMARGNAFRAIVIHKAGLPIESILSDYLQVRHMPQRMQAFLANLDTTHGQVAFNRMTRSLPNVLASRRDIERWLDRLESSATGHAA